MSEMYWIMMNYLRLNFCICFIFIFSACERHEHQHDKSDTSQPVFSISAPASNQTYGHGDTIWIKGSVADNELHQLVVRILRDTDGAVLFHDSISVHGLSSYAIQRFWVNSAADSTHAILVLKAWDHKPNVAEKRIPLLLLN